MVLDIKAPGNGFEIAAIYDEDQHRHAVMGAEWIPGSSCFATYDRMGNLAVWD